MAWSAIFLALVRHGVHALWVALLLGGTSTWAQTSAQSASRGQLLYTTHCIACHNAKMHWRDEKLASDWVSLKALVRRWQATALLGWSDEDIVEVARHLNATYYRFPVTGDQLSVFHPSNRSGP